MKAWKYVNLTFKVHRPPLLVSYTSASDWISRILGVSLDFSTLTIINNSNLVETKPAPGIYRTQK